MNLVFHPMLPPFLSLSNNLPAKREQRLLPLPFLSKASTLSLSSRLGANIMVRPFNTNPCLILMNMTVSWASLCWESLHVTAPHLRPPGNGAGFVDKLWLFFYKASCGWYFLLFYFNNKTIVSTRSSFVQIIQQMSFDWVTFVSPFFTLFLCLLFKKW